MTKEEIINKYNLSSTFNCTTPFTHSISNYTSDYYYLVPKFIIKVNEDNYEYTQSVNYLNTLIKPFYNNILNLCVYKNESKLSANINNLIQPVDSLNRSFLVIADKNELDKKLANKTLNNDDLLFAFRSILEDSKIFIEYSMDEFLESFGYEETIELVRKGEKVYKACEQTYRNLNISCEEHSMIIDNLSDLGIE